MIIPVALAFASALVLLAFVFAMATYNRPIEKWSKQQILDEIRALESNYSFLSDFFIGETNGPIERRKNRERRELYLSELKRREELE